MNESKTCNQANYTVYKIPEYGLIEAKQGIVSYDLFLQLQLQLEDEKRCPRGCQDLKGIIHT